MKTKLQALHQIEMTSNCNLACKYCVHKNMVRPKLDMDIETYMRALSLAQHFVEQGTQRELNLAGIGESSIHPNFVEWVNLARTVVGWDCHLVLSTNAVALTDEMIEGIAPTGISVYVSPHRPETVTRPIQKLKEVGLFRGLSTGASDQSVDWAGQIDWPVMAATEGAECPWVPNGRATVFADGRISTCCFDSDGSGVIGTLDEVVEEGKELYVEPYRLCGPCHHVLTVQEDVTNLKSQSVGDPACT